MCNGTVCERLIELNFSSALIMSCIYMDAGQVEDERRVVALESYASSGFNSTVKIEPFSFHVFFLKNDLKD